MRRIGVRRGIAAVLAAACAVQAQAAAAQHEGEAEARRLDGITVIGRRHSLVGTAMSASEGIVGPEDIARRPLVRSGDLIEFVPGLVATQHSGSGKANQYFLRGFNLDHGTDFSTFVDAMPVNLRTHGHGQGYTDLNFLIPELVESLHYRKGTYCADVGDFSAAGSARFELADRLDPGFVEAGFGKYGWRRLVFGKSVETGRGDLLLGGEWQTYDGPWSDVDEDVGKKNALLRWSREADSGRWHFTGMAYRNDWNSPDQIPQRAVDEGLIDAFGSLDATLGGESSRSSLSGGWNGAALGGDFAFDAYAIDYELSLWSNFTYFLDHPEQGDQFEQYDERRLYGFELSQQWRGERSDWRVGAQGRRDDIGRVGLFHTANRQRLAAIRDDAVVENGIGLFVANQTRWTARLRSYVGLRWDRYDFRVDAIEPENSGKADDGIASAKASLAWRAGEALDLYASFGQGFHSNDARGTTLSIDPASGEPADPVDPLVRSRGAELGVRFRAGDTLNATVALWRLHLDSELLFVGDAGNTEASRPSRRDGVEVGLYWFPNGRYAFDVELAWTDSEFDDDDLAGRKIPGSIPFVANLGLRMELGEGWFASGRLRHFDGYPMIEDDSRKSKGSTVLNLRFGKTWEGFALGLDVLNALDAGDHDIDYLYASRLPWEDGEGIEDNHFHPLEPRSVRLTARWSF